MTTTPNGGYQNRLILLTFPELTDGCSVLLRNPQLMAPHELDTSAALADGENSDKGTAREGMNEVMKGMIVAWRNVYPAEVDLSAVDVDGTQDLAELMDALNATAQEPLGAVTLDNVSRLPMAIVNKIAEQISKHTDPQ